MLVKINGQPQMSLEQFEETFKEALGRDMTPKERRWLFRLADFSDDAPEQRSLKDQAA